MQHYFAEVRRRSSAPDLLAGVVEATKDQHTAAVHKRAVSGTGRRAALGPQLVPGPRGQVQAPEILQVTETGLEHAGGQRPCQSIVRIGQRAAAYGQLTSCPCGHNQHHRSCQVTR
jgi:hypothetical protein